jgi:hypothetical protein
VIATGFQPEGAPVAERPVLTEPRIVAVPEPPRAIEPVFEPEPEPEPVIEEPDEPYEPAAASAGAATAAPALAFDPDDLDTPAYLRRGKLVN